MTYNQRTDHRRRPSEDIVRRFAVVFSVLLNGFLAWIAIGLARRQQWHDLAWVGFFLCITFFHLWAMLTREISDEDARRFGRDSFFGGPFQDWVLLRSKRRRRRTKRG